MTTFDDYDDEDFGVTRIGLPPRTPTATVAPVPVEPSPVPVPVAPAPTKTAAKRQRARTTAPTDTTASPAPQDPPAPPQPTGAAVAAKRPRKAADAIPAALEGEWAQIGPYDPTIGAGDSSVKLSNRYDSGLLQLVDAVLFAWIGPSNLPAKVKRMVGQSTIMEGLVRCGLPYINDPDLYRMMRADARRQGGSATFPIPAGLPRECDAWAIELPWSTITGTLVKHTGYARVGLTSFLDDAVVWWHVAHPQFVLTHGAMPGQHAFREALIRIGAKHVTTDRLDSMLSL